MHQVNGEKETKRKQYQNICSPVGSKKENLYQLCLFLRKNENINHLKITMQIEYNLWKD